MPPPLHGWVCLSTLQSQCHFAGKFVCFAFAGILIICGGDVKQGHTPLWYVCLIGRVQDIILASTVLISRETLTLPSDAVTSGQIPHLHLDSDPAWDPSQDPTATARSRTRARWARTTLSWSMLRCLISPEEEEPDRELCGEGDLGVCAWMESILQRKKWREDLPGGVLRASLPICLGAVEVEADRPVLTVAPALPPVLRSIASFKTSSAFLWLSRGRVCARSKLWSPNQAGHKLRARTRRWWVNCSGMRGLPERRGVFPRDGAQYRG